MSGLPTTREGLEADGYIFEGRSRCKACPATIEWWRRIGGRPMPMEFVEASKTIEPHWSRCPNANQFRRQQQKTETNLTEEQQKRREKQERERQNPRLFS